MKLIFLLVLSFFYLSEGIKYKVYNYITEHFTVEAPYSSENLCVYLGTHDFAEDLNEIKIYVTVYNGYVEEKKMYYGETNNTPYFGDIVELIAYETSHSSSYSGYEYTNYYNEYTLYFNIPKKNGRYLFLSFPKYEGTSIEIGVYHGFPVWAIISIVFGVIIVVVVTIIIVAVFFCRRRNSYYYNPPTNDVFQPPVVTYVQPAPSYPAPAYPPTYQPPVQPNYYG